MDWNAKLDERERLVIKAAVRWYDQHVRNGYGADEVGQDLLVLFRRCKALKAMNSSKWTVPK
jgi:hypothetical protein